MASLSYRSPRGTVEAFRGICTPCSPLVRQASSATAARNYTKLSRLDRKPFQPRSAWCDHGLRRDSAISYYSTQPRTSKSASQDTPDLIIVGFGLAGASAAIAAAENGASVTVLDRANGGGASVLSGGVVYAGGGTPYQIAAGCKDTPENMYDYLKLEVGDAVDEATLRKFCDESVQRLAWLEKHGARFQASLCPYKTAYPTDRHYLYYSGNELAHPYNQRATPAPRGHRMVHPGVASGSELWTAVAGSAGRLGVQVSPLSRVESLITENGRVTGVRYRVIEQDNKAFARYARLARLGAELQLPAPGLASQVNARAEKLWHKASVPRELRAKAVVLAAGGYAMNPAMRQEHVPEFHNVCAIGTPGDDGAGLRLGLEVGGAASHLDRMSAWRFLSPPTAFTEGVSVGTNGERIEREDLYGATFSEALVRKFGGRGYLVLDSNQFEKATKQYKEQAQPIFQLQARYLLYWARKKANSIADLAAKIGVPPSRLEKTIGAYNNGVQSEKGDPFKKTPKYCSPVLRAPFYAIDISVRPGGLYLTAGITLGGLKVRGESGLVLDKHEREIPGLYAAGRNAVGICSNGYISGLSLADCVFSGKRAGEHATKTMQKDL